MVTDFVTSPEFTSRQADAAADFVAGVYANDGDRLTGGAGDDVLFGGRGEDIFFYDGNSDGADVILDFTIGTDRLVIDGVFNFEDFIDLGTQIGGNTVFDFGGGDTLTLNNVRLNLLTEDDVVFDDVDSGKSIDTATASQINVSEIDDTTAADIAYWDADLWAFA